ncbi:hypothetical protein GWE18_26495 [Bradyrhizobium sp. CSA112]|uniref:hypothetical protein n=1 Tax=Bradyrhizobium sp. CSA112 TaxID=2699170 RepID=UPI0023AF67F8|nr:hypothetical protein [Bradyrhizobium sp. CSA112]MDE5456312.1 hypothetical protein [Bradyrhizobium sp. CSA112]
MAISGTAVCSKELTTIVLIVGEFLRAVVAELAKYPESGPGIIGRVVAKVQRQHLAPSTGHNVGSKYWHGRDATA